MLKDITRDQNQNLDDRLSEITRRDFLKVFSTGGLGWALVMTQTVLCPKNIWASGSTDQTFSKAEQTTLSKLANHFLSFASKEEKEKVLEGILKYFKNKDPSISDRFARLLDLFERNIKVVDVIVPGGKRRFSMLAENEQKHHIERWRQNNNSMFRLGYATLKKVLMAGYYSTHSSWDRINYPKPLIYGDSFDQANMVSN